jgi:hypothetical protein
MKTKLGTILWVHMGSLPSEVMEFIFSICQDSQTPSMYGLLSKETRAAADEQYWETQCKARGFSRGELLLTYRQLYVVNACVGRTNRIWSASVATLRAYIKPTAVLVLLADSRLCLYFVDKNWYLAGGRPQSCVVAKNAVAEILSAASVGKICALRFADVCRRSNLSPNSNSAALGVKRLKSLAVSAWYIRRTWHRLVPRALLTLHKV